MYVYSRVWKTSKFKTLLFSGILGKGCSTCIYLSVEWTWYFLETRWVCKRLLPLQVTKKDSHMALHIVPTGLQTCDMRTRACLQQGLPWGVGTAAVFGISLPQGLLFFLSCLLGSSSSLFFLQKGRKANLEHTQLTCHGRWFGPVLGIGSLTVKRPEWASPAASTEEQGKGARRRDPYLQDHDPACHSFPCALLSPGTSGCHSHNLLPTQRPPLPRRYPHFLSTSSSSWMCEEASHPIEGKVWTSRHWCLSLCKQRQEEGEKAVSS